MDSLSQEGKNKFSMVADNRKVPPNFFAMPETDEKGKNKEIEAPDFDLGSAPYLPGLHYLRFSVKAVADNWVCTYQNAHGKTVEKFVKAAFGTPTKEPPSKQDGKPAPPPVEVFFFIEVAGKSYSINAVSDKHPSVSWQQKLRAEIEDSLTKLPTLGHATKFPCEFVSYPLKVRLSVFVGMETNAQKTLDTQYVSITNEIRQLVMEKLGLVPKDWVSAIPG